LLVFFVVLCGFGCYISERYNENVPTEFFKIKVELFDATNSKEESFVISNPPEDKLLLKKIIEEYNFQTIPIDTIKKYRRYTREFYRETQCLTRNYEEGKPYPELRSWRSLFLAYPCSFEYNGDDPGQQIRYHYYSDDLHMIIYYFYYPHPDGHWDGGYWDYVYYFRGDTVDQRHRSIRIKDIDSLYRVGKF
jgi:hypothetical protein